MTFRCLAPRRLGRRSKLAGVAVLGLVLACLGWLDRAFPPPLPGRDAPYAMLVVARDGTPLRAFPDQQHVWRHPVTLEDVSPLYLEALVSFEDKTFWWHPGVNPWALARAAWQWASSGEIVSGGSTLTMQVARILEPTSRTLAGKSRQIARALQLEWRYSKREILALYLNYAPMGGVLEGVEAASRAYLGKPARRLSHAEAALLAALPQSPSLRRPDRHPNQARAARDRVLRRMSGKWGEAVVADAMREPAYAQTPREPLLAPLLAQRLRREAGGKTLIETNIDAAIQGTVELLLVDRAGALPPRVSLATIVIDNATLAVLAYAGSADFSDEDRFSHVDMVRAPRSPGSALKPFLYGLALDEGLIHSESLLADVPQSFAGYQPGNFQDSFHGPVSVSEALIKSLNVPAVEVLDRLGPARFVAQLRRGGLPLALPRGATPNLSVILGGAAVTLEDLTAAYTAFARHGLAGKPRFTPDAAVVERRMMSDGAAFIVRDILESGGPVGRAVEAGAGIRRGIAWKTGTSFGFRDAWAIGVSDRYTVGVWVGRPDGTPNPGFFGANVAAPLLVDIFSVLPQVPGPTARPVPASVGQQRVCWPLGTRFTDDTAHLCHVQRTAWILDGTAPPTFPDRLRAGEARYDYRIETTSGRRAEPGCSNHPLQRIEAARWPAAIEPWLPANLRARALPPAWSPRCGEPPDARSVMRVVGINDGEVVRRARDADPLIRLEVRGHHGDVMWLVNGRLAARSRGGESTLHRFAEAGRHEITALDEQGRYDRVHISVR